MRLEDCSSGRITLRMLKGIPLLLLVSLTSCERSRFSNVSSLVNDLASVTHSGIGYSGTVSGSAFAPLPDDGEVQSIELAEDDHPAHAVRAPESLTKLVALGVKALPVLLEHLVDARPTKLVITNRIGASRYITYSEEYDFNSRTARTKPERVNTGFSQQDLEQYVVTVGDLCFVAIGQIVNRRFSAVRYQPSSLVVVNSPLLHESLRSAVFTEWGGLTEAKHRQSLYEDIAHPDSGSRRVGAVQRLIFYYQDHAEDLILSELSRPLYCFGRVRKLVDNDLMKTTESHECAQRIENFVASHGESFKEGLGEELSRLATSQVSQNGDDTESKGAVRILAAGFPDINPAHRMYSSSVNVYEQADLIRSLNNFNSERVDQKLWGLFSIVNDSRFERDSQDYFGCACALRLAGKGRDATLREFCKSRLASSTRIELLRKVLARLDSK